MRRGLVRNPRLRLSTEQFLSRMTATSQVKVSSNLAQDQQEATSAGVLSVPTRGAFRKRYNTDASAHKSKCFHSGTDAIKENAKWA
jgi:hypothetical protein